MSRLAKVRDRAGQYHDAGWACPVRSMMPFQTTGVDWLNARSNALLGDDMGLGKTCQAIGAINALPAGSKVLIVCPATLRPNWLRELAMWLTTTRRCEIAKSYIPFGADVVIVNYDILAKFQVQLRHQQWDLLIVDEAHALKNVWSIRSAQVLGNGHIDALPAKRKILMTGTPILNRVEEVWPLLRLLHPADAQLVEIGHRIANEMELTADDIDYMRELLSGCMLRRMKKDVLTDLPEKQRQIIRVTPTGRVLSAMKAEDASVEKYEGKATFSEISELRRTTAMLKAEMPDVANLITEAKNSSGKLVVFVYHKEVAEKIAGMFPGESVVYSGDVTIEDRQAAVDRFQNDPSCHVFIGTIAAAGVGITLTAASHVIFLELDWTPGMLDQAEDRCWRYGQRNAVTVQYVVLDGSLDARQLEVTIEKQGVIDEFVNA